MTPDGTTGPRARGRGRLATENHRGVPVPRTLGFAIVAGAVAATAAAAIRADVATQGWGALAAMGLIGAAGLVDDLAADGPRGLRGHVRALAHGRVTTGIIKLLVIAGSSIVVVALRPAQPGVERVAAVVLLAASANVWNGLDVRPGRALKAFVPVGIAFVAFAPFDDAPAVAGVLVATLVALPFDLRERAMLGDAGANVVGFAAGLAVLEVLDGPWLVVAAAAAVVLNVVAETVTFSRVIAATAPLRWIDDLGRRP